MYSGKLLKSNRVLPKFAQILKTEIEHGLKLNEPKLETESKFTLHLETEIDSPVSNSLQLETGAAGLQQRSAQVRSQFETKSFGLKQRSSLGRSVLESKNLVSNCNLC